MNGLKKAGSFVLCASPSLMLFIYAGFVKSNHAGAMPNLIDQHWTEISFFIFAGVWQLLAVYALITNPPPETK